MKTKNQILEAELKAFNRAPNKHLYRQALETRKESLANSLLKYQVELEAVEELIKRLNSKYGGILTD